MWEKRKSVQKNKVFIFIFVLHHGETQLKFVNGLFDVLQEWAIHFYWQFFMLLTKV
jgi:hypothetical protein